MEQDIKEKESTLSLIGQFICHVYRTSILNLSKALLCSFLNVMIYVVIAIFILGFAQGFVIPVDLYMDTEDGSFIFNLFTFNFLLYFLAMIMSLYPTYIFALLFERKQGKYYDSVEKGLIYYGFDPDKSSKVGPDYKKLEFTEKIVRKLLGVALFNTWSWIIIYVFCRHQIEPMMEYILIVVNSIFSVVLAYSFWYYTVKIKGEIANGDRMVYKYAKLATTLNDWHLIIFYLLIGGLCFSVYASGWSPMTIIFQLVICLFGGMYLIIFRAFRKHIPSFNKAVKLLGHFRTFGLFTISYLVAINASTFLSEISNPINIILLYLITFYTIAIITIKVYLFLKIKNFDKEEKEYFHNKIPLLFGQLKRREFKWLFIVATVYFIYASTHGNNLHQLDTIQFNNKIEFGEYYDSFRKNNLKEISEGTSHQPILYAAYGGGLKAHYWNFLILDELKEAKYFNEILAMSGVSGGGMGIGNFTAAEYLGLDRSAKET